MARRKKKAVAKKGNGAEKAPSLFNLTGPEVREGMKYFSPQDLSAYELAQYKLKVAAQASQLKQNEAKEYQRRANKELAEIQLQKQQLDIEVKKLKAHLIEMQNAISEQYEVDLSKVTYDDETGRITEPPPNDAAESQPAA